MGAVFDTFADLTPEQLADFNSSLPESDSRCNNCPLGRNAALRALLDTTPESPADLD